MHSSVTSSLYFSTRLPLWLRASGFGLAYFLCALAGNFLSFQGGTFVSFWLPAGLYTGLLLVTPHREWFALIAAAWAGNIAFDLWHGTPLWMMLCFCLANTVQCLSTAWLLREFAGRPAVLFNLSNFLWFLIVGVIIGPALAALIGAATLIGAGISDSFLGSFQTWMGSTGMAVLLFSPLLLSWLTPRDTQAPVFDRAGRILEAVLLYGGMIVLTCYLLIGNGGIAAPFDSRLLPFLLWAGLRFGKRGASAACALHALLMTFLVTQGYTNVPMEKLMTPEHVFHWQIFLAINTLVGMIPAVILGERDRSLAALHDSEARFRHLNVDLEHRVTERTAELSAANQELETFSYSVSHDLRAPLRHIAGFAEMLKADAAPLSTEATRQIERIEAAVTRMTAIVDGLLNLTQSGRTALHKTLVPLNNLVEEVRESLAVDMLHTIEWKIDTLPAVSVDPLLMREALTNLLHNAVKYSSRRDPARIEVGLAPQCAQGNEIVLFIRDNGAGFDMRFVDKLFGICQRLHSESEFPGTGIGLANVQRIIHRHGGRIWAEGKVDGGASFYFSLPV